MPDPDFQQLQRTFSAHMRDPEGHAPPAGLDPGRLELYRAMVYRNIESFLATSFAQVKKRAGGERWHGLVRDFIRSGRTETPIFHELPGAFVLWMGEANGADDQQALLQQMAHFAWVRQELDFADDELPPSAPLKNVMHQRPLWSPLAWPLHYDWPVHRIEAGPVERQPVHLLAWRDSHDAVQWREVGSATALLAEMLRDAAGAHTGTELMARLGEQLQPADEQSFHRQAQDSLNWLASADLILGAAE